MDELLESHFRVVVKALQDGKLIPFLGAGVNLCGRPSTTTFDPEHPVCLPSGKELARYLADGVAYPDGAAFDLIRVAQFVDTVAGSGQLYTELHKVFDADYPPTAVHEFLAQIPGRLRAEGRPARYPLIVTTNYDDLMERALLQAGEPFDVVSYVAEGQDRGMFLHWPAAAGAAPVVIRKPNEYTGVSTTQRPVVLKIHGTVDRRDGSEDSFVITEDHYIEYLTRTDLSGLVPVHLLERLRNSHFLFLGYGLADWNLRVILHRIAATTREARKLMSWAIQLHPDVLEQRSWSRRFVDILDIPLDEYVRALRERFDAARPPPEKPAAVGAAAGVTA
jgi:hypothetical protein